VQTVKKQKTELKRLNKRELMFGAQTPGVTRGNASALDDQNKVLLIAILAQQSGCLGTLSTSGAPVHLYQFYLEIESVLFHQRVLTICSQA
jgi:hypothetical protein